MDGAPLAPRYNSSGGSPLTGCTRRFIQHNGTRRISHRTKLLSGQDTAQSAPLVRHRLNVQNTTIGQDGGEACQYCTVPPMVLINPKYG